MRGDSSTAGQDSGSVRYHQCRPQCSGLQAGVSCTLAAERAER